MSSSNYLNFDMALERSESGYVVRVIDSPAGQATSTFVPPFEELELENFLLRLGSNRIRTRRVDTPQIEAAKMLGGRLYEELFAGDVRALLQSSLDTAVRRSMGLRIRMRFAEAPELAPLPWEYLYSSANNRFLTLSRETPLVRYLELAHPPAPLRIEPPLRILVMIADPSDFASLDVDAEWRRLSAALEDLRSRGAVELVKLEDASLVELQRALRREEFHIFHFIGHGTFDESAEDGVLILEDEKGRGRFVSGQYIGTILSDHRSIRLALLNACDGARTSQTDPFAGVAQSLVQQGLPAVIAMQFEISDDAAIRFAHEFYLAMAEGHGVDAALAEGRRAIFAGGPGSEWGIPALFMRSSDGRLFDVASLPAQEVQVGMAETPAIPEQGSPAAPQPAPPQTAPERAARTTSRMRAWLGLLAVIAVVLFALVYLDRMGETSPPVDVDPEVTDADPVVAPPQTPLPASATPTATAAASRIGLLGFSARETPYPLSLGATELSLPAGVVTRPAANGLLFAAPVEDEWVRIDGDPGEWYGMQSQGLEATFFDTIVFFGGCGESIRAGVSDHLAYVQLAMSDENLYAAFWVEDDLYIPFTEESIHFWKGDSPQLMLDMDLTADYGDENQSRDDDILIDILPRRGGETPTLGRIYEGLAKLSLLAPEASRLIDRGEVRSQFSENGYFLETRIPWSQIIEPAPWMRSFGVAASVSDNDSEGRNVQECMISAAPRRSWGNPTTWGTLVRLRESDFKQEGRENDGRDRAAVSEGIQLLQSGDFEGGLEACDEAVAINPLNADGYYCIGFAHNQLDQNEGAIAAFTAALELEPEMPLALLERGLLYANVYGNCADGVTDLQAFLDNPVADYVSVAESALARCQSGQ